MDRAGNVQKNSFCNHTTMVTEQDSVFVVLASGNEVDLRDPDPADITYDDIVRGLAYNNRYNGQTRFPESVAQHSMLVADILDNSGYAPRYQMHGLLHDASEAFMDDLTTPVQNLDPEFKDLYQDYERKVLEAEYEALGDEKDLGMTLPNEREEDIIKRADRKAAALETYLFNDGVRRDLPMAGEDILEKDPRELAGQENFPLYMFMDNREAEKEFRTRFDEIKKEL